MNQTCIVVVLGGARLRATLTVREDQVVLLDRLTGVEIDWAEVVELTTTTAQTRGGHQRSPWKAAAARRNGLLGGRPKGAAKRSQGDGK